MKMKSTYQRSILLASILWIASSAVSGADLTAALNGAAMQPTAPTPAASTPNATSVVVAPVINTPSVSPMAAPDTATTTTPANAPTRGPTSEPRLLPVEKEKTGEPSQFQRFVQQATGRMLPIYGENLFNKPAKYVPISQMPVPNDYILGPGDEIRVQIWGGIDSEFNQVIDSNGQINLPKVGVVNLTGVRAGDLESVLRSKIGRVYTNFNLNATTGRLRSIRIYVVGQARQPGTYTVSSLSTLINALFEVGGPNANGSMRSIQLKRNGKMVGELDLYDFIARGDRSGDVPLQSGDVIVILPVGPRVAVVGAFEQPAIYELKGAGTVGDVLALGGGLPVLAKPTKALLERIEPAAAKPRQVEDFALDDAGLKRSMRDGDILTLLDISPQFANAVTLRGNVAYPLRYPYTPGMRIRDLIPSRDALITPGYYQRKNLLVQHVEETDKEVPAKAEDDKSKKADAAAVEWGVRNLMDEVNWNYAVIERLDRATLTTRLIPFNLGRAILDGDEKNNLALEPGDVITILGKKELRVPVDSQTRLVRVEGEVGAPGIYQVEAGETLPQLLERVGGVTHNAYLFGTEFTRESVRKKQQKNLDTAIHKLEAQLQAEAGRLIANSQTDSNVQNELIMQQQQMQQQLSRLKSLQSNGRISLELPPVNTNLAALPALPLEDGDSILIPSRPGFVSAVGEVYNDNAILYRPDRTVGDVLKSAGVSDDAELDNAFVLRADGSVMAARDHNSLFSVSGFDGIELMPGDTVVVPAKLDHRTGWTKFVTGLKDWTQILYQMGLGAAAWKTLN